MQTKTINSIKELTKLMMLITLLTITACNGKQEKSVNEDKTSSVAEEKPKPSVDIHTAALVGDIKSIREHIEAGSFLDAKEPSLGSSPLITAAVFGKTEVAKALIEAGADVNFRNNDGSTPLHSAAFLCRTEIVKALIDKEADTSLKNNFGSTALQSVEGPFKDVKFVYDQFSKDLGPFGFKIDLDHVKKARPEIAKMLR